jgi:glycine cleavage system H protein
MAYPDDRRYSETHEWHKLDGDVLTLGLTTFAVNELTDITYVEMKDVGEAIEAGDSVGEVESVKTTSDIYTQFAGEIIEVNVALVDDPSLVNSDPFGEGWLVKLRVSDTNGGAELMDAASYGEKFPA